MTNNEAIARIKEHKIIHKMNEPRAIYISEALDMAIKALEQEPCDVFDEYGNYKYPSDVELTEPNTATSMPCDTCKYSDEIDGSNNPQPCNDAISRQAVKELYYKDGYIDFRKICELPPVNPQPKIGHWIKIPGIDVSQRVKAESEDKE